MQRRGGTNGGRASIKSQGQRRVNQQQPVRGVAGKKKNAPKENNGKQQNVAPVGVSGVSLSNRFSSLQKEVVTHLPASSNKPKKNGVNVMVKVKKNQPGKLAQKPVARKAAKVQQQQQQKQKQQQQKQKMDQVVQASRTKRQATVNQRRKGLEVAAPAKGGNKSKPNGGAAVGQKKNKKNAPAPKGRQAQKPKDAKKKPAPVTGDDLDIEMDSYWHQAGKGPDPQQALLDRQMEQYWADKPKRDSDAAAVQNETTTA